MESELELKVTELALISILTDISTVAYALRQLLNYQKNNYRLEADLILASKLR